MNIFLTTIFLILYALSGCSDSDKNNGSLVTHSETENNDGNFENNDSNSAFTWAFIDSGGLNNNFNESAMGAQIIIFNSKLYCIWNEYSQSKTQIRIKVFNGDISSPTWNFVDGGGNFGLNKDSGQHAEQAELAVFESKLYAIWSEVSSTTGKYQIRVRLYSGDDANPLWTFVDGNGVNGINKYNERNATSPQLLVHDSKIYAIWSERKYFSNYSKQTRITVYNGNDSSPEWNFIDGNGTEGINKDTDCSSSHNRLMVFNSKVYAIWEEEYNNISQIRVSVYNNDDLSPSWNFVDGNSLIGINKDIQMNAKDPELYVYNNNLYAFWHEDNGSANQIRVCVYNDDDSSPLWTFVDGGDITGINKDTTFEAESPNAFALNSNLYIAWNEENGTISQIRLGIYNGNDSSPSWNYENANGGYGINLNSSVSAYQPKIAAYNTKLCAAWNEISGLKSRIRVIIRY